MHGRQLGIIIELLILYSLVYFMGFFKERLIFYDFFLQLKLSGHVYTLMAVSGLMNSLQYLFQWINSLFYLWQGLAFWYDNILKFQNSVSPKYQ